MQVCVLQHHAQPLAMQIRWWKRLDSNNIYSWAASWLRWHITTSALHLKCSLIYRFNIQTAFVLCFSSTGAFFTRCVSASTLIWCTEKLLMFYCLCFYLRSRQQHLMRTCCRLSSPLPFSCISLYSFWNIPAPRLHRCTFSSSDPPLAFLSMSLNPLNLFPGNKQPVLNPGRHLQMFCHAPPSYPDHWLYMKMNELMKSIHPLVAGCSIGHKPLPLHLSRWDVVKVSVRKIEKGVDWK